MTWYEFIITRSDKYKWYLFAPFFALIAWGAINIFTNGNATVPGLIFLFALIAWGIVWAIASTLYRKKIEYKIQLLAQLLRKREMLNNLYKVPRYAEIQEQIVRIEEQIEKMMKEVTL